MIFERGDFDINAVNESVVNMHFSATRSFKSGGKIYESKPTVFISHKHEDLKELKGVLGFIESIGAKVYIDSMDNSMPTSTSGETADRIKTVIKETDKFILLATDKAVESKWCNWELGIGDVHKYSKNIAILPMKEKGGYDFQYKGNEYMQIYPSIEYQSGYNKYDNDSYIPKGYYVRENGYITSLETWLNH